MRDIKDRMRFRLKVACLILAIIPVGMLAFIVVNLILESIPAIRYLGLGELFSTEFCGRYGAGEGKVGLLPALWGTFLAIVIAIAIALPVSLAMAVFSSEFPLGFLGRGMIGILGVLSGIPPVVYALGAGIFVGLFIIPNFCLGVSHYFIPTAELGISPEDWPPPGLPPWNAGTLPQSSVGGNSTLLGGMVLAMLVIPFIAPLIHDAIRNVPGELKEASLSLGASRWYTLTKVILPLALPGIIAATALGALKAMGDVLIVGWVIGFESGLPNPLWDNLERTAPLASTGAGLAGGFGASPQEAYTAYSIANFTGLMLLVMALAIMGLATLLQRRFKKRFSS